MKFLTNNNNSTLIKIIIKLVAHLNANQIIFIFFQIVKNQEECLIWMICVMMECY